MVWLKALHLIGVILWFSSLLHVSRMVKTHSRAPGEAHPTLSDIERRTQLFIGFPGAALTLITGVMMLAQNPGFYMKQGWMHGKLTLVIVAVVLEVLLFRAVRKWREAPGGIGLPLVLHILAGLIMIAIVIAMKVVAAGRIPAA